MPQRGTLLYAPPDADSVGKGLERACGKAYDDMGKAIAIAARSTEGRFFCELGAFASVHTLRVLHLHLAGVLRSSALSIGFNVHLTASRGSLSLTNYLFPHIYHALSVHPDSAPARTERVYGDGAPTFELQLAAFAAAVRGRSRFPITPADSVENMRWIDAIYDATGLGKRPSRDRYVTALFV